MFNSKNNKSEMQQAVTNGTGATLIAAGTTLTGDMKSSGDLRIDGTVIGNVYSAAKIIIGNSGLVEGDLVCNQADITGKITGNIRAKELLQLRGDSLVKGNVYTGKLQVEPTATFNGQCHMGTFTEEVTNYDQQKATV
ncbi:MAG TPA: polymer-forming cytoskeletal protein [Chitinophagaceae bacterium]|jgi:cytoskeletal protein CcmA (bactofilin family)|nr:polymer-forming cytoskeletal protein [Chitinophagaceae bacterium]HMU59159.1 polymer-forming cytoskeletal protein [Chitinophagaceae bacterium]